MSAVRWRTLSGRVVVATGNPGKVREIRAMLAGLPFELTGLAGVPPVVFPAEGDDYARNAAVKAETDLTISVGVATSKFVAKVASDCNKPDGLTVVAPGTEIEFLGSLPIARLWGVGPQQQKRLTDLGYGRIRDLQALDCSSGSAE